MKIAIDLNDVIRDYTNNFIKEYLLNYNREYNTEELSIWTNDMESVLPFKTQRAYQKFVYEDYAYELYGKCDTCGRKLTMELNEWLLNLHDLDIDENIDAMIVSPMEFGPTIAYTYFFLSKLNCNLREVYLPVDSTTIWDKCDILITANPNLIKNCPEGKTVVKIDFEYNKDIDTKYHFRDLSALMKDENNILKIIKNEEI